MCTVHQSGEYTATEVTTEVACHVIANCTRHDCTVALAFASLHIHRTDDTSHRTDDMSHTDDTLYSTDDTSHSANDTLHSTDDTSHSTDDIL